MTDDEELGRIRESASRRAAGLRGLAGTLAINLGNSTGGDALRDAMDALFLLRDGLEALEDELDQILEATAQD